MKKMRCPDCKSSIEYDETTGECPVCHIELDPNL